MVTPATSVGASSVPSASMSVSEWLSTEKRIEANDPVLTSRKRYVLLRSIVYLGVHTLIRVAMLVIDRKTLTSKNDPPGPEEWYCPNPLMV